MGAASCGASSTQALAQRRRRDSPQSAFLEKSIGHKVAKVKLIVFIDNRKNSNNRENVHNRQGVSMR
jgi:hypothetical protein